MGWIADEIMGLIAFAIYNYEVGYNLQLLWSGLHFTIMGLVTTHLLSCGCLLTGSSCPLGRGYRYYSDVNLCVRYCSTPLWWKSTRRSCAMDGGHVIYINSQAEYERLKDFINEWMVHLRDDSSMCVCVCVCV